MIKKRIGILMMLPPVGALCFMAAMDRDHHQKIINDLNKLHKIEAQKRAEARAKLILEGKVSELEEIHKHEVPPMLIQPLGLYRIERDIRQEYADLVYREKKLAEDRIRMGNEFRKKNQLELDQAKKNRDKQLV